MICGDILEDYWDKMR